MNIRKDDEKEPGCAVLKAVRDGFIPEERLESYHRLTNKLAFQSKKTEIGLKRLEMERFREIF
ncbi:MULTISPECIES: hypothetical protein [unclassified Methanosarcina]|uniref:hypothetical protein n=1 Tax=unclassified Methanosarcina TaxID=2644672 RepID=UPI0006154CAB|nr:MULTISPECIES: hypothetical protein [unclassified Methanosarcina]AKB20086.1 putative GTPase related to EngC [Methanosarcina sp. WWM596]AKB21654.1 putative GTPase related to EngC [Methanosarcina sp. WH1]